MSILNTIFSFIHSILLHCLVIGLNVNHKNGIVSIIRFSVVINILVCM